MRTGVEGLCALVRFDLQCVGLPPAPGKSQFNPLFLMIESANVKRAPWVELARQALNPIWHWLPTSTFLHRDAGHRTDTIGILGAVELGENVRTVGKDLKDRGRAEVVRIGTV